jgi:branched-chain amino acid aminotransferase
VTRGSIIRLCKEYDIPVYEKNFNVEDVHTADEVFVTGTFAGVIPVISVDGKIIGDGTRGFITKSLQNWYALDIEKLVEAS